MRKLVLKLLKSWGYEIQEAAPPPDLESLHTRMLTLENRVGDLLLAWAEVMDKLAVWSNRQAARDRARVKAALPASVSDELDQADPEAIPAADHAPQGNLGVPVPNGRSSKAELWRVARSRGVIR